MVKMLHVGGWRSVCAPLCCKNLCCASRFCTGGRGAGGSRSQNLLEGQRKQMLVQGDTLRLLDEAREPGMSSTGQENQDSQHMLDLYPRRFLRSMLYKSADVLKGPEP